VAETILGVVEEVGLSGRWPEKEPVTRAPRLPKTPALWRAVSPTTPGLDLVRDSTRTWWEVEGDVLKCLRLDIQRIAGCGVKKFDSGRDRRVGDRGRPGSDCASC